MTFYGFPNTISPIIKKERLPFIDKACGITILLVAYGHIMFPETMGLSWYRTSNMFVYRFHMPLFMCLSGYLAFLSTTNRNIVSRNDFWSFQKKKLRKFLPAYVFFSVISVSVDVFYHNATIEETKGFIYSFFFSPGTGSAVFVWYLYILMGFYVITPFLLNLRTNSQCLLVAFGLLLTNSSFATLSIADLFCKYFFFFLSGGLIYRNSNEFISFLERRGKWIVLFTLFLATLDVFTQFAMPYQVLCLAVIPSVLYISNLKWPRIFSESCTVMGMSSFAIYLLNTSVINSYYIVFKLFLKIEVGTFFIFSCLLLCIAVSILVRATFNRVIPIRIYAL